MPIVSIKHKGLRKLWENADASKVSVSLVLRLTTRLNFLDSVVSLEDFDGVPSYRFHELQGLNRFSIWVNGNWRLTFEWDNGDVYLLDLEDYH